MSEHVASMELCEELYKLSGWDDTYWKYGSKGLAPRTSLFGSKPTPAYDLGYLVRKIPALRVVFYDGVRHSALMNHFMSEDDDIGHTYEETSSSPEDAVCKLAIELFKQGILEQPHD